MIGSDVICLGRIESCFSLLLFSRNKQPRSSVVAKRPRKTSIVWIRVDEIFSAEDEQKNTKVTGKGRDGSSAPTLPISLTG